MEKQGKSKRSKSKNNYHHGNLRAACLEAGLEVIRKNGVQALSLREVARELGVSHMAPYRHFPKKEDLLAEIVRLGFVRFKEALEAGFARKSADEPYASRFRRLGWAYLHFAQREPTVFRLLFSRDTSLLGNRPELETAGRASFDVLLEALKEGIQVGYFPAQDPEILALSIWAGTHGVADLWVQGQLDDPNYSPEQRDTLVDSLLTRLENGNRVSI